ncbi:hypothetical protein BVRB_5g118620 [Beta vulgaris subsp. vulgaris]|nr:hypothetical protein BVRB_5g118620 [Beta vulgaris subsp. vulgaris]
MHIETRGKGESSSTADTIICFSSFLGKCIGNLILPSWGSAQSLSS